MNDSDLLEWWDSGRHLSPQGRALWYLHNDDPQISWEELHRQPIGERDRRLLALRARLFGSSLHIFTCCPQCGQELESHFDSAPWLTTSNDCLVHSFSVEGFEIRLLNSLDQEEMSRMSEEQAGQFLLEQCVTSREGQEKPSLDWVIETMLDKDRLAEILLQMACDQCGHTWSQLFDIVSFINRELDDYLSNLLQQIHVLACTYGWSEQQILALSAQRRAAYLEMVMA